MSSFIYAQTMSSLMPSLSIQEANDLFGSSSEDENDDDKERNRK